MKRVETFKLVCLMAAIGVGLMVDAVRPDRLPDVVGAVPVFQVATEITVTKLGAL